LLPKGVRSDQGVKSYTVVMQDIDRILQHCARELTFDYIRATGPGGQNVNKVATAVQLRFDVRGSPTLPEEVKARFIQLAGNRMTNDGVLVIEARRHRAQDKNREDAISRFTVFLRKSLEKPKLRRKTKPNRASKEKRLESKKKRGEVKRARRIQSLE
jgi:ribosome-associated protein